MFKNGRVGYFGVPVTTNVASKEILLDTAALVDIETQFVCPTARRTQKLGINSCCLEQESILPNFYFSGFLIFAVKLESL